MLFSIATVLLMIGAPNRSCGSELLDGLWQRSTGLDDKIRFCTAPDGVRIAYASVGSGPPLVKAAHWLTHVQYDLEKPCLAALGPRVL